MNHSTELKPQSFQWKIWGFLVNAGEQVLVNQNLQESSPILSGPISLLDVYNIQYLMRAELENETKSTQLWIIPFLGFHLSLSWCQVSTVSTWKERGSQSEHLSIDIVICKYIYSIYVCIHTSSQDDHPKIPFNNRINHLSAASCLVAKKAFGPVSTRG